MSYRSDDPNYTDTRKTRSGDASERAGDLTGDPPTNDATNTNLASKMANLLEGLEFPASKERIRDHLNRKSPSMGNRVNDVLEAVQNNLDDRRQYNSAYEIEVASGLVEKKTE
jgi:Protein of unknown function (DUF2795)